jgi:hypothetical protein
MSQNSSSSDIRLDTEDLVNSFCIFHRAMPNENQNIIEQVTLEVDKAEKHALQFVEGEMGQELIHMFERSGTRVYKRVFHPGQPERPVGADFVLYKVVKRRTDKKIGATAVQVKRNRKSESFVFEKRDFDQFQKLSDSWGSAYYLMVDETIQPPLYCFLTVSEVYDLVWKGKDSPPFKVSNQEVRNYCRGSNQFYDLFYSCNRGSTYVPKNYGAKVIDYVKQTKRIIVELSTRKGNDEDAMEISNESKKIENGKITSFFESL